MTQGEPGIQIPCLIITLPLPYPSPRLVLKEGLAWKQGWQVLCLAGPVVAFTKPNQLSGKVWRLHAVCEVSAFS